MMLDVGMDGFVMRTCHSGGILLAANTVLTKKRCLQHDMLLLGSEAIELDFIKSGPILAIPVLFELAGLIEFMKVR